MTKKEITVALVGNPNSGKTTVFNNLTGAHQHVGNWPGVTVEKKEGTCRQGGKTIHVVDLPGIYSLTAYSPDEVIARDFILEDSPDAVVDIVDASNLERNLYLTIQLMEMGARVIVALNMTDQANSRGYRIDIKKLSNLLGVPVVPLVASRNQGTAELLEEIIKEPKNEAEVEKFKVEYGRETEEELARLEESISKTKLASKYSPRWLAVKLLERDGEVVNKFKEVKVA